MVTPRRRPQRGWLPQAHNPATWQAADPQNRRANAAAQDVAAGGRARRQIEADSGRRVTARIRFAHRPHTRRTYAYLTWTDRYRRHDFLIGPANATTREANLSQAWQIVHDEHLATAAARQARTRERQNPTPPDQAGP